MYNQRISIPYGIIIISIIKLFVACKDIATPEHITTITLFSIQGIIVPMTGGTPVISISETPQYTGTVTWSPDHETFVAATTYTATITLKPKNEYTLKGVTANCFTVAGANTTTNAANTGVITAVFSSTADTSTADTIINISAIQGVTAPISGATPITTISETAQYTGIVTWSPDHETFAGATTYTATITLTPKTGFTLEGVTTNFFTIEGAISVSNAKNSGVITTIFPSTDAIHISSVAITVIAPVKGAVPNTTASGIGDYIIREVSWSPDDNPFLGGTIYTVTVTLTVKSDHSFSNLDSVTINGQASLLSNNIGTSVTFSYTFPATQQKTVTNLELKSQPNRLTYTHGDKLDLTGLVVTLSYEDTTKNDITAANFLTENMTTNPAHNDELIHIINNGQPVTITYGNLTPLSTDKLNVNKAVGVWVSIATVNTTYSPTLTLGDITLPVGYAFTMPTTNLNAGNSQSFAATYTNPNGNYEVANGNITLNVAKSGPTSWPTATAITYGTPLSASVLSGGDTASGSFAWTNSLIFPTVINNGYSVTFTPYDTVNYTTTTGTVVITVNKAVGGGITPVVSGYTHNGILLNAVTAATGQSVEYGISTSNNVNTAIWQTGLIFTGLNHGTSYYLFARSVENENYNTGEGSNGLQVTTRSSDVLTVTNEAEWNNALTLISTFSNGTDDIPQTYTITISGTISIPGSTSTSFGSVSNLVVTINGNGSLSLTSNGRLISATGNQKIIIDSANLTLRGRSSNNTSLISISANSTLELRNGTISDNRISNINASASGGGVYCSGIFIMTGGTISNNSSGTTITSAGLSASASGGGVYCSGTFTMTGGTIINNRAGAYSSTNSAYSSNVSTYGGGVSFSGINFTMTGGTINNNTSSVGISDSNYGSSYGGGVYFSGTNFNMTGGNINSNTSESGTSPISSANSSSYGGGLYISNGTFTLDGGSINNNTTTSSNNSSNAYAYGGGVYFSNGSFIMKVGNINNNTATSSYSSACGGGVYINSIFTMTGGTVSGNTSKTYGGGMYISNNNNSSFAKTGGIIYGNDAVVTNRNIVTGSNSYGHAAYYNLSPGFYRDITLSVNEDMYSTAPLPPNSGQTLNGWTRR